MTPSPYPSERLSAIACALGMSLDDIREGRFEPGIVGGLDHLRHDQALTFLKAFQQIENPKTRAMIVGLVEQVAALEGSAG